MSKVVIKPGNKLKAVTHQQLAVDVALAIFESLKSAPLIQSRL